MLIQSEPKPNKFFLSVYKLFSRRFMSESNFNKLSITPLYFFADSNTPINEIASKFIFGDKVNIKFSKDYLSGFKFVKTALNSQQKLAMGEIKDICNRQSIDCFFGGSPNRHNLRINLDHNELNVFLKYLLDWSQNTHVDALIKLPGKQPPTQLANIKYPFALYKLRQFDLWLIEKTHHSTSPKLAYHSKIEIDTWTESPSYSDPKLYSGVRQNTQYSKITQKTFFNLKKNGSNIVAEEVHNQHDVKFDIDIVYTWVNDQDKRWNEEKEKYSDPNNINGTSSNRAKLKERFRNRDELKYSLRSVELFAPFVRNIFIVTADQTPEWLNTNNKKIKIISHNEIYTNPEFLPTFNSSGIETQLHHIKDLSEHFLYFNDDFILGNLCSAEDFFYANGALKFFPSDQCANENDIDKSREEYIVADKNAIELLKRDLNIFPRSLMLHCPYPSSKSLLNELEESYQAEFNNCASNRFRSFSDLRPIAFMQYHYGFAKSKAFPDSISHRYLALWKPSIVEQMNNVCKARNVKTMCINDVGLSEDREEYINMEVNLFLENLFPEKSIFEK